MSEDGVHDGHLTDGPRIDAHDPLVLVNGAFPIDATYSTPDDEDQYGSYGKVDDRKVEKCDLVSLKLPNGKEQAYRRIKLKFAPLSYNQNTVERRALISATSVGGTVFILVAGSLATRFKKVKPDLEEIQESFRATASAAFASSGGVRAAESEAGP